MALIWLGIMVDEISSKVVMFIAAALHIGYDYWAREKILYAAKIITHSTIGKKTRSTSTKFVSTIAYLLFRCSAFSFLF